MFRHAYSQLRHFWNNNQDPSYHHIQDVKEDGPPRLGTAGLPLAAIGALAISLYLRQLQGGLLDILSELICWVLFWIGLEVYLLWHKSSSGFESYGDAEGPIPTIIAIAVAIGCFATSFEDVRWITPLLTPALLAFRKYGSRYFSSATSPQATTSTGSLWVQTVIALASTVFLSVLATEGCIQPAILTFAAQFVLYAALHQVTAVSQQQEVAYQNPLISRATLLRTVVLLAVTTWVRASAGPRVGINLATLLLAGVLKAVNWILLLHITSYSPWDIATTISTFGLSAAGTPYAALDVSAASGRVVAALAALTQTYLLLPKSAAERRVVFVMALSIWPLLAFLIGNLGASGLPSREMAPMRHPIEVLTEEYSARFNAMLERQSTNLTGAVQEYKRRYTRDPPPGFDKWFAYAKVHNAAIIDDYDIINNSLEPFWKVSPAQLRANVRQSVKHSDALLLVRRINGTMKAEGEDWGMSSIIALLTHEELDLPDFEFVFNQFDEPRVLLSDTAEYPREIEWHNEARKTGVYEAITSVCPHKAENGQTTARKPIDTFGLPFVQDMDAAMDLCANPQYEYMHGFLQSPSSLQVTHTPIPIFSQCKPSTFADLILPSAGYRGYYNLGRYKEGQDPPWSAKTATLYWAGSTTGSTATNSTINWQFSHRQRFVAKANHLPANSTQPSTFLTQTAPGVWQTYQSTELLRALYDARFTGVIQCDEAECAAQRSFFHVDASTARAGESEAYGSRFVFDADGNAFSGRFYVLLRSRSVVLKQTLFREWHDERLFPWVHYVPVSLGMDELPEVMRYLALTEEGDRLARRVAERGREWRMRALRAEDEVVYMYRLFLEYARVMADGREDMRLVV